MSTLGDGTPFAKAFTQSLVKSLLVEREQLREEVERLRAALDRLVAEKVRGDAMDAENHERFIAVTRENAALRQLIDDGLAGGTDGMHPPRCKCLWHEAARELLASPAQATGREE